MAGKADKAAPVDAAFPDIAQWGSKSMKGAYAPGTMVDIGGEQVDLSAVPDLIGGEKRPAEKPKAARDRAPKRQQ